MDQRMELLAPAGDINTAKAAFAAGADACYVGGKWSARAYAKNFGDDELKEIIRYAHLRSRKIYVALNTMLYEREMESALSYTRFLYENMADAVIAADLGFIREAVRQFPGLAIHASTQAAVQGAGGAELMRKLGCTRVIAARESSLSDLSAMTAGGMEVEAFCHGSMCSGVSGVCLLSGMVGGRSGNRGRCAQPCRLPYTLFSENAYHLSTKDLCTLGLIGGFAKAGVCALKIEGRMKNKEYVASTVDAYRRAIDAYYGGDFYDIEKERGALARIFNRGGFTEGYLKGGRNITYTLRPDHMGVEAGILRQPARGRAYVETDAHLRAGDGVEVGESGYALTVADPVPGGYIISVPKDAKAGEKVYLRADTAALKRAQQLCKDSFYIPVTLDLYAAESEATRLTARSGEFCFEAIGEVAPRGNKPADAQAVTEKLLKTGGTVFRVTDCNVKVQGQPFLSAAGLNALRRRVLFDIEEQVVRSHEYDRKKARCNGAAPLTTTHNVAPYVAVQVRNMAEAKAAWQAGANRVYLSPGEKTVLADARIAKKDGELWLVLPAYLSADEAATVLDILCKEEGVYDGVVAPGPEGAALAAEAKLFFISDYWQNIANTASVRVLEDWGARGVAVSAEINLPAVAAVDAAAKELVVYGRLPLMNLRHCPVKKAEGCEACGRGVLRDRLGYEFSLLPEKVAGCILQVYNAVPMAMTDMAALRAAGVCGVRLIFTDETEDAVRFVTAAYCRAWESGGTADLGNYMPGRVSNGHLYRGVE